VLFDKAIFFILLSIRMTPHGSYTDEQLVASLANGDAAAFTEIYERYWSRLLAYAMGVIRQQSDAEDIVQELFVSIWRRRRELHVERALSTYLYNSIRYLAIRHIEKNSTYSDYLQRLGFWIAGMGAPDVEADLHGRELQRQIDQLIQELPEKMREVFVLSRRQHLSYKEIAERLSISEETVRKQVYKSLQILRTRLGPLPHGILIFAAAHFF
jgi:RNA polymerase sigma-70 factor (family 1)